MFSMSASKVRLSRISFNCKRREGDGRDLFTVKCAYMLSVAMHRMLIIGHMFVNPIRRNACLQAWIILISVCLSAACYADAKGSERIPPRQKIVVTPEPYEGMPIALNPPTFRWPESTELPATVTVRSSSGDVVLKSDPRDHYYFRPLEPLPSGEYEWSFTDANGVVTGGGHFELSEDLEKWPVAPAKEAVNNIPSGHPRVHTRPEKIEALKLLLQNTENKDFQDFLRRHAGGKRPDLEPLSEEFFFDVRDDSYKSSKQIFWKSGDYSLKAARGIVENCILYQLTGEQKYAEYVKKRALAIADLNPWGLTTHDVNQFGNSRLVNALGWAYSWLYDQYTEEEREKIRNAIVDRCRIALLDAEAERWPWPMIPRLEYTKVEPHAWQFVVYHLSVGLIAVYGESPEAQEWLPWLIDLYVANYPWFSGSDGGSAEQVPYFLGTNLISSQQAVHLVKTATGLDLAGNPWHRNAPYFMIYGFGTGANASQYGDNSGRPPGGSGTMTARNAAVQFQDGVVASYYDFLLRRASARNTYIPLLEAPFELPERKSLADLPTSRLFSDVGLVFMRSEWEDPNNEIFMEFKSSTFGSIGHGHNDQNSFNLSAYGKVLLLDSGFYNYYDSPHHNGWTRTTRAHNAILMDGTGQPGSSDQFYGEIVHFEDTDDTTYTIGDAHRAYNKVDLERFDRHVLWIKPDVFVIADDVQSSEAIQYQYMLHAKNPFKIDGNVLQVDNEPAHAKVTFIEPTNLNISQSDQFLKPIEEIVRRPGKATPVPQWHMTAETPEKSKAQRFITVIEVYKTGDSNEVTVDVVESDEGVSVELSDGRKGQITWRD